MKERHQNIPASYLVLLKNGQVLLLRRFNTGYEDGKYSLIAGHLDPGESFTRCIIREAEEEAGIVLDPKDLQVVHVMHRDSRKKEFNERIDVFFLAEKWQRKIINKEPEKCDDLSWFNLDELPENILPYIRKVLEHIRNKIFYSEFGWK